MPNLQFSWVFQNLHLGRAARNPCGFGESYPIKFLLTQTDCFVRPVALLAMTANFIRGCRDKHSMLSGGWGYANAYYPQTA